MANVLVVGGGFAGVWSAAGIVRTSRGVTNPHEQIRVTLIDSADDMVIRPRLYEADPQRMRVPLDRILGPIGVRRIAATVTAIDTDARCVTALRRDASVTELAYDRLVLAAGSRVVRPRLDGAQYLFDVDTMPAAAELHAHIESLPEAADTGGRFTAVVIGAGFTGLEVSTELVDRLQTVAGGQPVRVVLIERADTVGPELGEGPRPLIIEALAETGVEVMLGVEVRSLSDTGVSLSDGTEIPARTVVWTAGMRASALTEQIPGERDALGRLRVDEFLQVVGVPNVYAVGDTAAAEAEPGHVVMQSCQHAVPQGKFSGVNVASDLLGLPQVPFAPDPYVTCLDLGSYGAILTVGWDRAVQQSRAEAKNLKHSINAEWIYPPVDDAATILRHADHRTTWPTAALG